MFTKTQYLPTTRIRRFGVERRFKMRQRQLLRAASSLVAVLLLGGLVFVWSRLQVTKVGYALEAVAVERERLMEENRILKLEIQTLHSPRRLQEVAETVLRMRKPLLHQTVFVPAVSRNQDPMGIALRDKGK